MHTASIYCSKQLQGIAGVEKHKTKPAVISLAKLIM